MNLTLYVLLLEVLSNPEFTFNVTPSPITLFRFSALTFNAHLIHYDHTYATEVEKQKGKKKGEKIKFFLLRELKCVFVMNRLLNSWAIVLGIYG